MSIQNPTIKVPAAVNFFWAARPSMRTGRFSFVVSSLSLVFFTTVFFAAIPARGQTAATSQPAPGLVQTNVKLVIGGQTIKNNSQGTLSVVGNSLQFATAKAKVEVEASSILDISTHDDSRQNITGAAHLATMAIPYGGGRVLSLFSHQVDVLTVEFKDGDGGYHGAVFVLPQSQAAPFKKQLVAMGAKASVPLEEPAPTNK
jgi:hypothetical protein